jgi:hypothetical protein
MKRVGDLEIGEDIKHQQREWRAEHIGWLLMALLLAGALLGLLGPGPFSSATAGTSPLWVEYNRFDRYQAPAMLKIHLGPGTGQSGTTRVWIDREYIQGMEVQDIEPEPDSMEVSSDRITYVFQVPKQDQPIVVVYHVQANSYGSARARLGVEGGPQIHFTQFIFP